MTDNIDIVKQALKRAFSLGQTYWQQADSDYSSQHKKSDVTLQTFLALVSETSNALAPTTSQASEPLTDERIEAIERLCVKPVDANGWGFLDRKAFARAIEAAHGIKP